MGDCLYSGSHPTVYYCIIMRFTWRINSLSLSLSDSKTGLRPRTAVPVGRTQCVQRSVSTEAHRPLGVHRRAYS